MDSITYSEFESAKEPISEHVATDPATERQDRDERLGKTER